MSDCLFCRIIDGSEPASIVMVDDHAAAFLDVRPLFHGHTLVVPREHHVTLPDLPPGEVEPFFARVQAMARLVPEVMEATGSFVAMNNTVSQSVAHLHAHVVPRRPKDGLRGFFWPRTTYDSVDERDAVARRLADAWRTGSGFTTR